MATTATIIVTCCNRRGATLRVEGRDTLVSWADLRGAAAQHDPELRLAYSAALTEAMRQERRRCLSQAATGAIPVQVGAQRDGPGSPVYVAVVAVVCPSGQVIDLLRGGLTWGRAPGGGSHYRYDGARTEAAECVERVRASWPRVQTRPVALSAVGTAVYQAP
jgi:hypothetical protein